MIWEHIRYALPEASLIIGILHLFFMYLLSYDSAKIYARIARFWLLVSLFWAVAWQEKSFSPLYFTNDAYTLLFNLCIGFLAYIMIGLASTWFSTENKTGCKYYILILSSLIGINLLLSSSNLVALLFCYILLTYTHYRLLGISYEKLPSEAASRYMGVSAMVVIIFAAGFGYLNSYEDGNVEFTALRELFLNAPQSLPLYLSAVAIIIPFLYSLGLAPFHIIAEDKTGKGILPVSHYFALIAPLAFWGCFIKLNVELFKPLSAELSPVYQGFALLSVIFGAMGANARINLHRILSYSSMYHFGIVLILLSFFKSETNFAAFVYLFVYIISLNGSYLVFYSLKSHGEYLSSVTSLSGLAETRAYTTGALLVSLFSFIGLPPLVGFLGQLNAVSELLKREYYISLGIILFFLLILSKAYLDIIKTAYFEHKIKIYDSENKSVMMYTLFSVICIVLIAFNPQDLFAIMKDMFDVVNL